MTGGVLALASAVLWGFSGVLVKEATPRFGALYVGAIGMGVTAPSRSSSPRAPERSPGTRQLLPPWRGWW